MSTITDILIAKGALTKNLAVEARKRAKDESVPLEDVLYSLGVGEADVLSAKSEVFGLPAASLENREIPYEVLQNIPEESARYYKFVPIGKSGGVLEIGMVNPDNVRAQEALRFIVNRLGLSSQIYLIGPTDFEKIVQQYKSVGGEVTKAVGEFEKELEEAFGKKGQQPQEAFEEAIQISEEAPVTKMMGVILRYAVEGRASDVHIEPTQDKVKIRFRVDGILYTGLFLPKQVHSALITKIKVMTNMKIDESRVPQDGRFHARVMDREIDFRVSTFPTSFGEKVAIRILDSASSGLEKLEDLGIEGRNLKLIMESIQKPFGMILITGPTGSGKSTTLNAILHQVDREGSNVVSLEDPIEYYIPGVNQSQVRPEINYDFATGLRHILRQDPDIIMVGEIRDKETAQLAVHAALTGHLVLSTLHTNNAIGVIPRLIDMGIDPFLIPSTLILAVAQRLARKLCPESRKEIPVQGRIKETIEKEMEDMPKIYQEELKKLQTGKIYEGEVSSTCPKGSRGRIGVYEMFEMTKELEKIVIEGPSETKIMVEARRQNMLTMRQDGLLKVFRGMMGIGELLEVT